jgi:hypothetical protein
MLIVAGWLAICKPARLNWRRAFVQRRRHFQPLNRDQPKPALII